MLKILHFSYRENVLSEVTETGDFYVLKNPLLLILHQTENGLGMAIEDYLPFINSEEKVVTISKDKPLFVLDEDQIPVEIKNEYNRIFSGIVIPETQSNNLIL